MCSMPTPINDDAVELLLQDFPRTCDEQAMRDALAVRDWRKVLSYAPKDSTIGEGLFVPEG